MQRDALFSPCGMYRYRLARRWSDRPALTFVMLNPSTADAAVDDPTIRRCIGFARREEAGGIVVVNLYGYRATDPDLLRCVKDPFGPGNDLALGEALSQAALSRVVCAWGADGRLRGGVPPFIAMARHSGACLVALGFTRDGHPKHPLYVSADQPFIEFTARSKWESLPVRATVAHPGPCGDAHSASRAAGGARSHSSSR